MNKCELCKRTEDKETKSDHLRTIYIGNNNHLCRGYFRPYLTEMEFYLLDPCHNGGEHTICSNRKQCQNRRRRLRNE